MAMLAVCGANVIPPLVLYLKRPTILPGRRERYVMANAWSVAAAALVLVALPPGSLPWVLMRYFTSNEQFAKTLTLVLSQAVMIPFMRQVRADWRA